MHIVQHPMKRIKRNMNLPHQRPIITAEGLGELHGFNIGKMFKRMVHFTPRSFQPKNIFGAIGSAAAFTATAGMSSALFPKTFSAHSKVMRQVGMGISAAALAAGAVIAAPAIGAALPAIGSALSTVGSTVSSIGGGLFSTMGGGVMKMFGGMFGGRGGGMEYPQQISQQIPDMGMMQPQPIIQAQPVGYVPPTIGTSLTPTVFPSMSDPNPAMSAEPANSNTQLQSPSSENIAEMNPVTGQPIQELQTVQAGMIPQLSTSTWIVLGGLTVIGTLYFTSGKK